MRLHFLPQAQRGFPMWFNLSSGSLFLSLAVTLAVVLVMLGVGWAAVRLLSHRD